MCRPPRAWCRIPAPPTSAWSTGRGGFEPTWPRSAVSSPPISGRMADKMSKGLFAGRVTHVVAGAELGALLGWMSGKVLGQYDLLVVDDDTAVDQDIVYYVGPNVLALEKRFAFPSRVSPVAGPARGHPPGAVHGRAMVAPPLPEPGRGGSRADERRPCATDRGSPACRQVLAAGDEPTSGRWFGCAPGDA